MKKMFRDFIFVPECTSIPEREEAECYLELMLWRCIETYNRTEKKIGNPSKPVFTYPPRSRVDGLPLDGHMTVEIEVDIL